MKNETLCLASLSSLMARVRFGGGKKNHLYLGIEKIREKLFLHIRHQRKRCGKQRKQHGLCGWQHQSCIGRL